MRVHLSWALALPALVLPLSSQDASRLTLEKLYHPTQRVKYVEASSSRFSWLPDGHLLDSIGGRCSRIDPSTGTSEPWMQDAALNRALVGVGAPEDEARAALERGPSLWDEAMDAFLVKVSEDLYRVEAGTLKARRLTRDGSPRDAPAFSPDGTRLAYLRGNDLYALDLATGRETRLTHDGSDTRLNGRLDWVYNEEVYGRDSMDAFWWSPDSRRIAFLSLDVSREPVHMLTDDRNLDQKQMPLRYPKAGEPNAAVRLGIADMDGRIAWMDDPYPGQETLVVQVGWDPQCRLLASYQDRTQTWLELRRFQKDGSRVLVREQSKAWQDRLPLPRFLKDGGFLWLSDRTGYRHLYRCDAEGKVLRALTAGSWDVREVYGVDEKESKVFFAATERSPIGLDTYSVSLGGRAPNARLARLTDRPGTHEASFNKTMTAFLDRWSTLTTPHQVALMDASGKRIRAMDIPVPEAFQALKLARVKFQQVKTRDGFPMETCLFLPPDFDPAKKYPVFEEVYGGPNTPTVQDAFGRGYLWFHFLAQQGYVVWICDNRSASNKGPASAHPAHKRLGQTELADLLDGLEWLRRQGWADMDRVALDGWSYGGFMTAYALTHSQAWKVGIAGAPVTDFRLYDSIYTERYMGLPRDNPEGYEGTDLAKAAKDLHGHLLIFHGTLDDNVHPQNSIRFIDALEKADKPFQFVVLPGSGHGPRTPEQVWVRYRTAWEFLQKHL